MQGAWFWISAGLLFAGLAVLTKRERLIQAVADSKYEVAKNLALWAFNRTAYTFLGLGLAAKTAPPLISWNFPNVWAALILAFVVMEIGDYWLHRLRHSRWLWLFHKTHHSDRSMTWTTVHRKHPIDYAWPRMAEGFFLVLLGIPLAVAFTVTLARSIYISFLHADLPWTLGSLRYVLNSPLAHRYHHALDERLAGSNFGGCLSIWDRMFGTYVEPDHRPATGIPSTTRARIGGLRRMRELRRPKTI